MSESLRAPLRFVRLGSKLLRCEALSLLVAVAGAFSPLAAQESAAPLTEAAVREARARSNAAIAARDTAALVRIVSPSYHSVSSRNAHTNGRDGVAAQWRAQFAAHADVSFVRTPMDVRVFAPWQMAEESGTWVGRWAEPDGRVEISPDSVLVVP